jgi:predicted dehydrogenase
MTETQFPLDSPLHAPDRKPRLGFLGVGWIGFKRMEAIANAGLAEVTAIADPSLEALEKAVSVAPDAARVRTLDDLLSMDLDALVIATPSAQHASETISALQRGLAVFCQKPLGRDASEVRSTIDAARAADRLLGVDLSYRYTEAMQKIRPLVRSGSLGKVYAVDLVFHNAYGPQKPWFYNPIESGGGCVVDLGIHLVDAAFWTLDEPIVGVTSRLFHQGKRIEGRGAVSEDYASARLDLAGDTTLTLACSWNLHAGRDAVIEISFYGTEGGAALRNVNGSFTEFTGEHFTRTSRTLLSEPPDAWGGRAAVAWARQLAAGQRYDPEIERILDVTLALDAIYERAGDA